MPPLGRVTWSPSFCHPPPGCWDLSSLIFLVSISLVWCRCFSGPQPWWLLQSLCWGALGWLQFKLLLPKHSPASFPKHPRAHPQVTTGFGCWDQPMEVPYGEHPSFLLLALV